MIKRPKSARTAGFGRVLLLGALCTPMVLALPTPLQASGACDQCYSNRVQCVELAKERYSRCAIICSARCLDDRSCYDACDINAGCRTAFHGIHAGCQNTFENCRRANCP